MKNILVPVDGSDAALRALKAAVQFAQQQSHECIVHVLNVQAPVITNNAARFFAPEVLQSYYQDEGNVALEKSNTYLATVDVPSETYVEVGHVAEIAKKYVEQKGCDHIVMGTRGLGAVPGLLLGSVATKILHSLDVPVTLIK